MAAEPVTIKKYANRRLYNTGTSTYVTLEDLAAMVKAGEDFIVHDAKTGEDITRQVLAQIIFEQENKEGQSLLPIAFLRQLIRFYGDSMQMLVPRYLEVRSARSRTRCGGTWKCSNAPLPCSRRSRGARDSLPPKATRAMRLQAAAAKKSPTSSARWKRCRSVSTG